MKLNKLVLGSVFAVTAILISGCNGGSSGPNNSPAGAAALAVAPSDDANVADYQAGTSLFDFTVADKEMMVDGVEHDSIDSAELGEFPTIAHDLNEVLVVDRVVETKERALELYSAGSLVLALDLRSETPSVLFSRSGFSASKYAYSLQADAEKQGLNHGILSFEMTQCAAEKEQGQEEGKQEQGQDIAKLFGTDIIDKGGKEPAQSCKMAMITLHLNELEKAKEVEQGKEQGKVELPTDKEQGQEQGKEEGKQEQGQDADKGQDQEQGDKGQDQDQDQTSPAPAPAPAPAPTPEPAPAPAPGDDVDAPADEIGAPTDGAPAAEEAPAEEAPVA